MPATTSQQRMNDSVPPEPSSPSSRRKGKIAEALQSMANLNNSMESLDMPTDPDAQATVTDFLDFTEYLPSDMIRSLTLIGNLDQTYSIASANVHDHTKIYGELPSLPVDEKPDPLKLRGDISGSLGEAVSARTLSHAEASRMADNVDRHYNRVKNILAKLQAMAENYPPTREPSPVLQKAKSPVANRIPKITIRLDGSKAHGEGRPRVRKHRAPRITVPGEVLAPYELDYESYGSDTSMSESEEPITPRATPGRSLGAPSGKIRLKISKPKKDKAPKPPRGPRPPGVMGTNVHSAVAGISTSNALAKLSPPPATAVKGDKDLPWLQLNAWELAILRKRMKKNAIWSPSDTMIARELQQLGRGIEAYRAAKTAATAEGRVFDESHEPPQLRGETVHAEGAISVEAVKKEAPQVSNRGMVLNQAKKLKKEIEAKELAAQAASEVEQFQQSTLSLAGASSVIKALFEGRSPLKEKKPRAKTPSKAPSKKRKRDSPADEAESSTPSEGARKATAQPAPKRSKTETPVPVPLPGTSKRSTPILPPERTPSVVAESVKALTPIEAPVEAPVIPPALVSPRKPSAPILPPVKEPRKIAAKKEVVKKPEPMPTAANSRPRRTSIIPPPISVPIAPPAPSPPVHTPAIVPETLPPRRPTSSRSKAASDEPPAPIMTATSDRPRRTSTARNTPAPEPRQPSKRAKRPAPGVITTNGSEGSSTTTVSVGRRKATTRKKAAKKEKKDGRESSVAQEALVEVDDEGNVIDPDEPRYCTCNRVSFGTMIGCENEACEKEWFHLECVGLDEIPARTTKWYCPECRVTLGIGEKGEVNARGKKK